ncbi:hypothetical protein ACWED2_27515 [Amycolatopsis sp. NPDC005003]
MVEPGGALRRMRGHLLRAGGRTLAGRTGTVTPRPEQPLTADDGVRPTFAPSQTPMIIPSSSTPDAVDPIAPAGTGSGAVPPRGSQRTASCWSARVD